MRGGGVTWTTCCRWGLAAHGGTVTAHTTPPLPPAPSPQYTGYARTAFVGFSQGTAQCFAALALHPSLNRRLSVFVALSPAVAVRGLARSPVSALVESDLGFLFALFGRRRMLPSALDVQVGL
jgi:hypothetical protein